MQKLLSRIFLLCLVVGLNATTMIYGWGLHPRSWWWIIGSGVIANSVIRVIFDAVEAQERE